MAKKLQRHPKDRASAARGRASNINPLVIDIYHGDTIRSFARARHSGIRGIIHKATEGSTPDPAFARRRPRAAEAGLLWGAYHLMRPGDPIRQADHFVDEAKPDPFTLLAIDHEDGRVPLANAIKWMCRVEERVHRKVVLYSGWLIKEQIPKATAAQKSYLADRRLWLADYNARPKWPSTWRAPWLWQFTGDGKGPAHHSVPGLHHNVDIDSYVGTAAQLAAEWAGERLPASPVA
jgi:lysozyme